MTIRPTTYADINTLLTIFAHAKRQMAADGNPTQWSDNYPTRQQLEEDIQRGVSYILEHNGVTHGTFVFIIGEDPTYQHIENGRWLDENRPYGTIHRIASDGRYKGGGSTPPSNGVQLNAQISALTPTQTTTE